MDSLNGGLEARTMHHSGPTTLDTAHSTMSITINEGGGRTQAKVELHAPGAHITGFGIAFRHPSDYLKDDARLKMATARALSDLAGRLAATTAQP
jgi:Rv2632c-like